MDLKIVREYWRVDGVFAIARGAQTVANLVVVELRSGGRLGHGECEPQDHYGESVESVVAQIESIRNALAAGLTREELQSRLPPGAARNAVDCAMWDLEAKLAGRSAWELASLEPRTVVTDYSLSLDTPGEMHRRLALVDPDAAAAVLPSNGRRVVVPDHRKNVGPLVFPEIFGKLFILHIYLQLTIFSIFQVNII